MAATVDFPLSAKRHWLDAVLLESNARTENAGQLYGFAAECGIKAILVGLKYPTDADGSPVWNPPVGTPQVRKHVHKLTGSIGDIQNYVQGRNGAKYTAMIPSIGSFSDWDIEHRYWTDAAIPNSLPAWKVATKEVMSMLDAATLDGVLQ